MMTRTVLCKYETISQFLQDIDLICSNALEYNPDFIFYNKEGSRTYSPECSLNTEGANIGINIPDEYHNQESTYDI